MKSILCFFLGHDWLVVFMHTQKHFALSHLHPMAGMYARCERCGKVWNDLPSGKVDKIAGWKL